MSISTQERLARIRINAFLYFRADWLKRLIDIFGSAQEILKQDAHSLAEQAQMNPSTAAHFLKEAFSINPEEELEKTEKYGGRILVPEDEEYPQSLRDCKEAPIALYVLGDLPTHKAYIGMVGTRKITAYGRRVANTLSTDLTQAGAVVVSGLARGIDSECHAAAVRLQKPTIAVIGTGIGRCYPAENRDLARAILQHGGALVSELPFNKPPHAFHFPRRNRIIAALSELLVVVEGEVKSGALITAKLALEMGKDVLAVPGPIDSPQSAGPNNLIKDGAGVVTSVKDIIDYIPSPQLFDLQLLQQSQQAQPVDDALPPEQQKIMHFISTAEVSTDQIVEATGLSVQEAAGALFELEVKGLLCCKAGLYSKSKF
ncbi:MAG: DNA-processing protein DprA [Elusimicrobiaceae bacterium]|nr:DNA-processing protein DprA [Elusimicrobiaceae bacterium]